MSDDEKIILDQSMNKLEKALYSEGYREGLSSGRDLKFQQGFDTGYSQGFQAGYALGLHNGVLRYLKSDASLLDNSFKEQLFAIEGVEKASRGLCIICSQEKDGSSSTDAVENSPELRDVSKIKERQERVVSDKKNCIMTDDYSSILSSIGLDSLLNNN